MTDLTEPTTAQTLRYLYHLLPPDATKAFEEQCRKKQEWQDQVDYISYLLEDLHLPLGTPFDLVLILLNYEMIIRKENIQLALSNFVKSEEESYELEIEIDQLLSKLEAWVEAEETASARLADRPQPSSEIPADPTRLSPGTLLSKTSIPKGRNFLDTKLQQLKQLLTLKRIEEHETVSRFSSGVPQEFYTDLFFSLNHNKIPKIRP